MTGSADATHSSGGGSTIYLDNAKAVLPLSVNVQSPLVNDQIRQVVEALCPFFPPSPEARENDHQGTASLRIRPIEGGLSNELFVVESSFDASLSVLLRIHPSATDEGHGTIVDREMENRLTAWLSRRSNSGGCDDPSLSMSASSSFSAPIFYGRFQNGRVEEFYPNHTPLSYRDMPAQGPRIARLLARLHKLNPPRDVMDSQDGDVWLRMKAWRQLAEKQLRHAGNKSDGQPLKLLRHLEDFWLILQRECDWLEGALKSRSTAHPAERFGMQTVLTHMDCQPLNILRPSSEDSLSSTSLGPLKLIDYEYAGRNPRVVDIGNTFCEYMDLNHLQGAWDDYPSAEMQTDFLAAYLDESLEGWQTSDSPAADGAYLAALRRLVNEYSLVSHLEWALWSCVQCFLSNIEYDYLGYAKHRMQAYNHFKGLWFEHGT